MTSKYNAVIVGQTGVGKSTLVNYLYGQTKATVGVGRPVTAEGFYEYDFEINSLPVRLYDSWGLEVGKEDKWLKNLDKELENRGVNKPADQWFHSVFYCIQAGGARIQDCDLKIINKFIKENYKVCVILTKCDQVNENIENELRKVLISHIQGISVISICSEEKETRSGISKPFGKLDVQNQAFNDFFDSLIARLPLRCKVMMESLVMQWVKKSTSEDVGFGGHDEKNVRKKIRESAEKLAHQLCSTAHEEIKKTLGMYGSFADRLGYPPTDFNSSSKYPNRFGMDEKSNDWQWWEIPIGVVLSPIAIIWGLLNGKENSIEEVNNEIAFCKKQLNEIIEKQVNEITKILISKKSEATENKIIIRNF